METAIAGPRGPRACQRGYAVKIATQAIAALGMIAAATFCDVGVSHAGNGGAVAAGLLGGFAAGAIIATAPRYYYGPPPAYYAPPPYPYPAPAYAPECHWTRGEPMWNGYAWVRPRVQVCD